MSAITDYKKKYPFSEISQLEMLLMFSTIWISIILVSLAPFFDISKRQSAFTDVFKSFPPIVLFLFTAFCCILSVLALVSYWTRIQLLRRIWLFGEMFLWLFFTFVFISITIYSPGAGFSALYFSSALQAYREVSKSNG